MNELTFRALQDEVGAWQDHHFPDATPTDRVLKLGEECGELFAAHGARIAEGKLVANPEELDAIGDMTIVLAGLCANLGVNYSSLIAIVWKEVQARSDERVRNGIGKVGDGMPIQKNCAPILGIVPDHVHPGSYYVQESGKLDGRYANVVLVNSKLFCHACRSFEACEHVKAVEEYREERRAIIKGASQS